MATMVKIEGGQNIDPKVSAVSTGTAIVNQQLTPGTFTTLQLMRVDGTYTEPIAVEVLVSTTPTQQTIEQDLYKRIIHEHICQHCSCKFSDR